MKIYVNERYEIVDVNTTTDKTLKEYEISDEQFKGKCIEFIRGYKYEPVWKIAIDPETNLPQVDEEGNKFMNWMKMETKSTLDGVCIHSGITISFVRCNLNMKINNLCWLWQK